MGGLGFLLVRFIGILTLYATGTVTLTTLIQVPNATFILTYLGGAAAAVRLLRGNRLGVRISWVSLILTAAVFPFVGWAAVYPLIIGAIWWFYEKRR